MKIEINGHPIISDYGIRFLDISAKIRGGIEVQVLKVEFDLAEKWVEYHRHNHILDSEGEEIILTPKEWLFSDLFLNNQEVQKKLIQYIIELNYAKAK